MPPVHVTFQETHRLTHNVEKLVERLAGKQFVLKLAEYLVAHLQHRLVVHADVISQHGAPLTVAGCWYLLHTQMSAVLIHFLTFEEWLKDQD